MDRDLIEVAGENAVPGELPAASDEALEIWLVVTDPRFGSRWVLQPTKEPKSADHLVQIILRHSWSCTLQELDVLRSSAGNVLGSPVACAVYS
jgi:hypothetical protein